MDRRDFIGIGSGESEGQDEVTPKDNFKFAIFVLRIIVIIFIDFFAVES